MSYLYNIHIPRPQICNNTSRAHGERRIFLKEIPLREVILRSASRKRGPWNPGDPDVSPGAMRPDLISDKELRKLVKTSFPVVSVTWREVTLSDVGFVGGGVDGKLSYTQTGVDYPVSGIRSRNRDVTKYRRLSCQPAQCHRVYVPLYIFTILFSRVLWKLNIPCAKSLQLQLRRPTGNSN